MFNTINGDPFLDRESKNYENPIPSREFILKFLAELGVPMSRNGLFEALRLSGKGRYEGLKRRLRAMERDGQIVFVGHHSYALPEKLEMVKGFVIGHKDGYGWVRPKSSMGKKDADVLLPYHQMRTVIHGDYVLIRIVGKDKRCRSEGRLVQILEQRKAPIVGRFFCKYNSAWVLADDSRINQDVLIPNEHRGNAQIGSVVAVEIIKRDNNSQQMKGRVIDVLGKNTDPGIETKVAIHTYQIPNVWLNDVDKQLVDIDEKLSQKAKEDRVDLRDLPLVTIDDEDACDFDDALFCEVQNDGGWRLWVAVADVSYYIRPNTALDREAMNRGNSVYFPSQVVPMLPEIFSNNLCSLNPKVDRLCMVCEMTISNQGKLLGYKHYEAVMNSHARLTYNKVDAILKGDEELCNIYRPIVPNLKALYEMYRVLKELRRKRGAIEFETVETKFIFNADLKIEHIEPVFRNDAHKIVEECMILANIASASLVEEAKEPALFRIHESPDELRLEEFRSFLGELGLNLEGGKEPSSSDYANLMKKISERQDKELIQNMLLRSMKQAVYSPDNCGHFGLALKRYAHFTSPIRRYPDLLLHRVIKYILSQRESRNQEQFTSCFRYSLNDINFYGEQCSMTERRANEATRNASDWLKCEYMQDYIGKELEGLISNVTSFGFFVRLTAFHIDGLVHISSLRKEYYRFDLTNQRIVGENSGTIYRLGDVVAVKVLSVSLENRKIDFELAETKQSLSQAVLK
ncbi:ribonuclease R [Candidatus Photodesmus blepharus]|uniref:Ribonuclease R n=1 Tax=Candidatus Photodesmus blepharonis TaxID=1179155 RepID=A0A084CM79_9GAMM